MPASLRAARRLALLVSVVFAAALSAPAALAQAPACSTADLDTTLRFALAAPATYTVAVLARNTATHACVLAGHELPSFVVGAPSDPSPIKLCLDCGGAKASQPAVIQPGETAHVTYRWTTPPVDARPDPAAPPCPRARWLTTQSETTHKHGLFVVAPSLLPPVCSQVSVSAWERGSVLDDDDAPLPAGVSLPPVRLSSPKPSFVPGELMTLTMESGEPASGFTVRRSGPCPAIFLRQRAPDGYTRIDELRGQIRCITESYPNAPHPQEPRVTTEIDTLGHLRALDLGANTVQLSMLTERIEPGRVALAESNELTLTMLDPASLPRRWGITQHGVHVDLSVDKQVFSLGEDIPLHIAAQVVSAPAQGSNLYAEPFVRRAESLGASAGSFQLFIQAADGPEPNSDRPQNLYRATPVPSGEAVVCPAALKAGEIVPLERSLKLYNLLPVIPGAYTLSVAWTPYTTQAASCERATPQDSIPLATVYSNPVTIHITGGPATPEEVAAAPEYTAWQAHFQLVDTPEGKRSALLDKDTGIEWLRLSYSANRSQESLSRMMGPKHPLDGWRFATLDEVIRLFADFTGTHDGVSRNPLIEREFQELLGGPLSKPKNVTGGMSSYSRGAVAGFLTPDQTTRPAGAPRFMHHYAVVSETVRDGLISAEIRPDTTGWIDGDTTSPALGTFIVRKH